MTAGFELGCPREYVTTGFELGYLPVRVTAGFELGYLPERVTLGLNWGTHLDAALVAGTLGTGGTLWPAAGQWTTDVVVDAAAHSAAVGHLAVGVGTTWGRRAGSLCNVQNERRDVGQMGATEERREGEERERGCGKYW